MNRLLLSTAAILALGACSDRDDARAPTPVPAAAPAPQAGVAAEPVVALGLTARQLEDADILAPTGREIGEVERVVTGPDGVVRLLVEVEDSNPDRYVTLPLDGLTVVQSGNDRDLQSNLTRDQLMAMPETPR